MASLLSYTIISKTSDMIDAIKETGKSPIMFLLIGSCQSFSKRHENPEILEVLAKNPKIKPLVIIIDPSYKITPPEFMIKPFVWEYPDQKVPFIYFPNIITDEEVIEIIDHVAGIKQVPIAVWSFTGNTFGNDHHIQDKRLVHIPPGNCMANTKYNSDYNPLILLDRDQCFIESIKDMTYFLKMFKNEENNLEIIMSYVYTLINEWVGNIKISRSWCRALVRDPIHQVVLDRSSTEEDWEHFNGRMGFYYTTYIKNLRIEFEKSSCLNLLEYIDSEICTKGLQLIQILNAYLKRNQESSSEDEVMTMINCHNDSNNFLDQHFEQVSKKDPEIPNLFHSFRRMVEIKFPQIKSS